MSLTPAQILAALQATTVDMMTPGFDHDSGYGLVQADYAIETLWQAQPRGTLALKSATYSVTEMDGVVRLAVSRSDGSFGAASVTYNTANGSATAGSDYTVTSGTLSWTDGDDADKYIDVPILDDAVYEGDEQFTVTLSGATGATLGSPASATVTITDNETPELPVVTVEATTPVAGELNSGYGRGVFTIRRSGSTVGDVVVYYSFSGTAQYGYGNQGGDWYLYGQSTTSITIKSGQTSVNLNVYITNDATPEPDETVTIAIEPRAAYVVGDPSTATILIKDDEQPVVSVTATDGLAGEPGSGEGTGTFTFWRLGLTSGALTVGYSISGTASEGVDYDSMGTSVTIPAGDSFAEKVVTVKDDVLVEGDETVVLTLTGGSGYSVGSPSSAQVIIKDDDIAPPATVTITALDYVADEGGSSAVFALMRTGPVEHPLTVNIEVGGTATSGTDYSALEGVPSRGGVSSLVSRSD